MGLEKNELLLKASQAATEYTNEEIIFLDPEIYWELEEPRGSLECYFYYEDKHGTTKEIIIHAFANGKIITTLVNEDSLGEYLLPDGGSRKKSAMTSNE